MDITLAITNSFFALLNLLVAYFLLRETRILREVETFPEMTITLEKSLESQSLFDIVVRNIGKGAAYNIKFDFDSNASLINQKDQVNINHWGIFKGLRFFGPNQEYRSFFGDLSIFKITNTIPLLISVQYQNHRGKKFRNEYLIDPLIYHNRNYILRKTTNDFYDELKMIRESISEINDKI